MKKTIIVMIISLVTNLILSSLQIVIGFFGNSRALLLDGIHSLSDMTTDVVIVIGSVFAAKPADEKHPYGHGKIEYLLSIFIGAVVIFLGFNLLAYVGKSASTSASVLVIYASSFTIVTKLFLSRYVLLRGREYNSSILISSGIESRADVITSIFVLISAILMQFDLEVFKYADFIASIMIGIFIIKLGFDIIKENTSYIIGEQETNCPHVDLIKKIIVSDKDIIELEKFVILKFGHYKKLIAEVSMTNSISLKDAHDKIDVIEKEIRSFDDSILYITFHMSPYVGGKK